MILHNRSHANVPTASIIALVYLKMRSGLGKGYMSNEYDRYYFNSFKIELLLFMHTKRSVKGADWNTPVGLFAWAKMKYRISANSFLP